MLHVSIAVVPSLKQNLLHICCSLKYVTVKITDSTTHNLSSQFITSE